MSNPQFPTLTSSPKSDSSGFQQQRENVAMKTPLDGGYVTSRPAHTRRPRRIWVVQYTDLTPEDKAALDDFWTNTVLGSSVIFDWIEPTTDTTIAVRFGNTSAGSGPSRANDPLNFAYKGIGPTQRWDCRFVLEEA